MLSSVVVESLDQRSAAVMQYEPGHHLAVGGDGLQSAGSRPWAWSQPNRRQLLPAEIRVALPASTGREALSLRPARPDCSDQHPCALLQTCALSSYLLHVRFLSA